MRTFITPIFALIAQPAFAHPGHVAPKAGHSHWEIYAALTAVVLIGLIALRKAR